MVWLGDGWMEDYGWMEMDGWVDGLGDGCGKVEKKEKKRKKIKYPSKRNEINKFYVLIFVIEIIKAYQG
jgi:hypothetical protein